MVTGGSLWWRLVAFGAREVEDEALGLGGFFAVHGVNTMQKLIGQVGEHGGAAWGDAPLGSEDEEALEILIDGGGGVEFGEFREEFGGKVFVVAGREGERKTSGHLAVIVPETEAGLFEKGGQGAAPSVGITEMAARRVFQSRR